MKISYLLQTIQPQLRQLLSSENFNLLQDIVVELKEYDEDKWSHLTVTDLFPDMLRDAKVLMAKCLKEELGVIANILHSYTGRAFFSQSFLKATNANLIARAFKGTNFVQQIQRRKTTQQSPNPITLVEASTKILLLKSYPIIPMQVAYAKIAHWVSMCRWINASQIQMVVKVPRKIAGLPPTDFRLFCYPEYAEDRQQLEPCTLDYSHVITNVRMHICRHGYDFCKTEHYLQLCQERPDILSKSIVEDNVDPQNVFTTVRFFNPAVQMFMIQKVYREMAYFIEVMRNWFRACNDQGMKADEHVEHWVNMYNYLTQE